MAARARARGICVRLMAADAASVCRRREHRLIAMARRARRDLGRRELVGHVTARAFRVAERDRRWLGRVARRAARIGGTIGLVHVVAIEAAARAGVLGLLIGVALEARLGLQARCAMRRVARAARLIAMRADRVDRGLRSIVTAHAVPRRDRLVGTEAVAVLTRGRMEAGMERRHHAGVALRAEFGWWRREASIAVTGGARDLPDVDGVTCTCLDERVGRGDLFGHRLGATAAAQRDHEDRDRVAHQGREPIGWHIRHGSAPSGTRLDQPGGCTVPPIPPTW